MPKTQVRRRRSRPSPYQKRGGMGQIVEDMNEIVQYQKQQVRFGQPNTPDIMFPMIKQKTYTVVAGYTVGNLNVGTTSTAGAYSFSLNVLPSVAAFTGCFDRYKVLDWNLQFNPIATTMFPSSGPLFTCIDYDDANTPTSEISQRDTAMAVPIGTYFERTLKPRIAVAAYSGSFTSYANLPGSTWVDVASPSIQYYGLKFFSTTTNATAVQVYAVTARVHLKFKNNF